MASTKPPDPPLPYLETFSKVAELSSFTAAAKELGLTQAAVSQRIHSLEETLHVALFEREGGQTRLSDAGRQLHPFAQRILALHREAIAEITGQPTVLTGELTLAASSIPGEHLLPPLLALFRQKYPQVRVRVSVTDSSDVLADVESGKAQLGLVGGKADHGHLDFQPFATDEMVVIVPPVHAWSGRQRVSVDSLATEPLILREPGSGSRWCLEQAVTQAGRTLDAFHIALELGSNEAIKEAVSQGMGVSVISTHAVEKELRAGMLHAVHVTGLPLKREFFVVHDTRRALPATASAFLEFVKT